MKIELDETLYNTILLQQSKSHLCIASKQMYSSKNSKHHPDQPCACILFDVKYYSYYETWGPKEREFLMRYCRVEPEPSSCICLVQYREAQRTHPAHFIPKWKENGGIVLKCVYPDCLTSPKGFLPHLLQIVSYKNVYTYMLVGNSHYYCAMTITSMCTENLTHRLYFILWD